MHSVEEQLRRKIESLSAELAELKAQLASSVNANWSVSGEKGSSGSGDRWLPADEYADSYNPYCPQPH
jgi:hypothetical protein